MFQHICVWKTLLKTLFNSRIRKISCLPFSSEKFTDYLVEHTHSNICLGNPMELDGLQSTELQGVRYDWVTRKQHEMLSCFALYKLYPSIVCFFFKESLWVMNEQCLCKFSECVMKTRLDLWFCWICSLLFCWLVNNQVIYSYGHIYMQLWCQNSKGTHFPFNYLFIHSSVCSSTCFYTSIWPSLHLFSYPSKTYELTHPTCQVWC